MNRERLDAGAVKLSQFGAAAVLVLTGLFMLLLTFSAFIETGNVSINNEAGELVEIYADNIFLNALMLILIMASFYLLSSHCLNFSMLRVELLLMGLTFVLGIIFIISVRAATPWYSDSYQVLYAAEKAALGEYGAMDAYFCRFPFQLGYVMYVEIFYRIVGGIFRGLPEGYYRLALQGVNLLWLMLSYHAIIQLSWLLFQRRRVQKFTAILLMLCLPPVLSCTFLYGNIPGFALGFTALWLFADFIRKRRMMYGLLCALFMGLAVAVKLNLMIFFVAIVIVWLFDLLRNRNLKSFICLALTVAAVLLLSGLPQTIYERRSGKDFGEGIPMIAWMAMGLNEGHAGPGWYKEDYTVTAFMNSGMDAEATADNARRVINERAKYFASKPGEALSFFSEKLRSQWNEPSYESIWINQVQLSYGEKGTVYDWLCGSGARRTAGYMNQYQQVIFLGALLACLFLWRRRDMLKCLPVLVILGGMLYHLLFEAKSQYALPYFMLMIPLAAYGFCMLFHFAKTHAD